MSQRKLLKRIVKLRINALLIDVPPNARVYKSSKHYHLIDTDTLDEKKYPLTWVTELHKANCYDDTLQIIQINHKKG